MEDFKVAVALDERPNKPMQYTTLDAAQSQSIVSTIARLAGVTRQSKDSFFTALSTSLTTELIYGDELTEEFLRPLLCQEESPLDRTCYVLWDTDEPIDQFDVERLLKDWKYIWYPASDEAMIMFFPVSERLILVTDYGLVKTNF